MSAPEIRLRDISDELTRLRDENRELRIRLAEYDDRISELSFVRSDLIERVDELLDDRDDAVRQRDAERARARRAEDQLAIQRRRADKQRDVLVDLIDFAPPGEATKDLRERLHFALYSDLDGYISEWCDHCDQRPNEDEGIDEVEGCDRCIGGRVFA